MNASINFSTFLNPSDKNDKKIGPGDTCPADGQGVSIMTSVKNSGNQVSHNKDLKKA